MKRYLYIFLIIIIFIGFAAVRFVYIEKLTANISAEPVITPVPRDEEIVCGNSDEIEDFKEPVSVVWTAKLDGCLESCNGAAFTRIPVEEKYPRFSAHYTQETKIIADEFLKKDLVLKISGKWTGINYDHPATVFDGRCVPIVEIEKIEAVQ